MENSCGSVSASDIAIPRPSPTGLARITATHAAPLTDSPCLRIRCVLQTDYIDTIRVHWLTPWCPSRRHAAHCENLRTGQNSGDRGALFPAEMARFSAVAPASHHQPPYNLFEREIETRFYHRCWPQNHHAHLRASLRGLLSGRHALDRQVAQRRYAQTTDPKFSLRILPSTSMRPAADAFARENYGKRVFTGSSLASRSAGCWCRALGRAASEQLAAIREVIGWSLGKRTRRDRRHSSRNYSQSRRAGIHGSPGSRKLPGP